MSELEQPHGIVALFFRDGFFYPIQFMGNKPPKIEAEAHARLNPGTQRIEDMEGNILWQETVQ